MKIALIGATGNVGSRILAEALRRGHEVTGIARHADKLPPLAGLTPERRDLADAAAIARLLTGYDSVIVAVKFQSLDGRALIDAVKKAGVTRLLVVGGAGSLEVSPGLQLVDTPDFPAAYKPESLAARDFLNLLRGEPELNWTFLSPARDFEPGERTGKFRLGGDQLLTDAKGASRISIEDFAVALLDEIERLQHIRRRFTVAY